MNSKRSLRETYREVFQMTRLRGNRVRELVPEIEFTNPFEETEPVRWVHLLKHTAGFDDILSLLESSWLAPGPGLEKVPTAHLLFAVDLILARCHRPDIPQVTDN